MSNAASNYRRDRLHQERDSARVQAEWEATQPLLQSGQMVIHKAAAASIFARAAREIVTETLAATAPGLKEPIREGIARSVELKCNERFAELMAAVE